MSGAEDGFRLDKWLWCARFYRTRALAQQACSKGRIRVNGNRVEKPGRAIRPGDVLTLPVLREIVVLKVISDATRRGPATEARQLYEIINDNDREP
jgi:ribosome-associated heat shock protein Hsp15